MKRITNHFHALSEISINIKNIYNHFDMLLSAIDFDFEIEYKKMSFDSRKTFFDTEQLKKFNKDKKKIIQYIISDSIKKLVKASFKEITNKKKYEEDDLYSPVYNSTSYLRHILSQNVNYSEYEMKIICEPYEVDREQDKIKYEAQQLICRLCPCEIKDCIKCDEHHEHVKTFEHETIPFNKLSLEEKQKYNLEKDKQHELTKKLHVDLNNLYMKLDDKTITKEQFEIEYEKLYKGYFES